MSPICLEFEHDPIKIDDRIEDIVNNVRKVGIEIETETLDRADWFSTNIEHWRIEGDGSLLENGSELVSEPIPKGRLLEHLCELKPLEDQIFKEGSVRTSVHIHVDCSRLDPISVVVGWILIEPYIMNIYPERYNNLFCSVWNGFSSEFLRTYFFGYEQSDFFYSSKYKSLSLFRYPDLKTVEYRFLPLLPSLEDVAIWADFLAEFTHKAAKSTYAFSDVDSFSRAITASRFLQAVDDTFGRNVRIKLHRILKGTGNTDDDYFEKTSRLFNDTDAFLTMDMIEEISNKGDNYV